MFAEHPEKFIPGSYIELIRFNTKEAEASDDFIEKPFDLNVVTAKVQAMLRRAYSFQGNLNVLEHQGLLLNLMMGL